MRSFTVRFAGILLFFGALTVAGTVGYVLVEGWSVPDALYMTVITLTAVGYEEVHPLTSAGQTFTMLLLAGGITGVGIWFALLTAFIVENDLAHVLRRRRREREIAKMKDHVVVCGAGRTGRQVLEELVTAGQPFVVIERDPVVVESLQEALPDAHVVAGDAETDQTLIAAGIDRARAVVCALSADADNLFTCLSARHLNPDLLIVARAHGEEAMEKMFRAGADRVVSPNVSSGIQMASFIVRPSVMSLIDVATHAPHMSLRFEQARVPQDSALVGITLRDAQLPTKADVIVIGLEKSVQGERKFTFNPTGDSVLEPDDEVIVLGGPDQVHRLRSYMSR